MKTLNIPLVLSLVFLAACASPKAGNSNAKDSPETVEVTYHVRQGNEAELQRILGQAWTIYTAKHLVIPQSHAVVIEREYGNRTRIVETFTWVSHSTPDHAPDSIKDLWNQMQDLCEARGGHDGLEINEVKTAGPNK